MDQNNLISKVERRKGRRHCNCSHQRRRELGISIVEFVIALTIATIVIVGWLELAAVGVKSGSFVVKLGDVKDLASAKAAELIKQADELAETIPKGRRQIGSIAPALPLEGFSDLLDEQGRPYSAKSNSPARFARQWMIVKDQPGKGEVTVFVTVVFVEGNRRSIFRAAKAVKTDGLQTSNL